ncbi:unnamed protein product, partial [Scytosiphon promiscuus]
QPWEPLSSVDYAILGFNATFQVAALLICVHLLWCRKWPPYVTKNVNLVVIATLSGVLWTLAMAVSCGFIEREAGDILAACDFERFLTWSMLGVHTVAFFVRVYRMWRILIKHDDKMWRTEHQILLLSSLSLIPVLSTWAVPDTGYFDEVANTCYSTTTSSLVTLGMDVIGFCGICFLWFVCVRQLKSVRKQFNEYETMKRTLLYTTVVLFSYAVVVVVFLGDDLTTQRRVAIFYPFLTTYNLLWGSIREPFMMKMLGDDEYLWSYTKGFSELPSPAQLKASLAEQLSVDQLRQEFRRYVKTRVAQELVDFYLDSLDREEFRCFWIRPAVTMRIVEQFIRDGAPDQVNISEECRDKILATDVTAYDIFDDARKEVLAVMETNFQRDFVTSEGYQRMLDAAEDEQRELRLLRAGGIMPLGTPPLPGPAGQASPSPTSPLTAASGRGSSGSRPTPLSPPLIAGLIDAIKKLPSLAKNARAVGHGGADGGAGVGLTAASAGAAATPRGSESAARLDGSSRPAHIGNSCSRNRGGGGQGTRDGGLNTTRAAHGGGLPLRVAVPHQPSSSALSVSISPSGASQNLAGSESPSIDSLRGVRLSSGPRPGGRGSPKNGGRDAGRRDGGSTDVFDWVPREDGVEGLDVLSSVTTGDSPDWVRFSDWIRNGNSGEVSPGRRGGGPSRGADDAGRMSRSWGSGGSSWSNIKG